MIATRCNCFARPEAHTGETGRVSTHRMRPWRSTAGLLAVLALSGCGKTDEEKARDLIGGTLAGISEGLGSKRFVNDREAPTLHAKLKQEFVPFSFDYPSTWDLLEGGSQRAEKNFVKVERKAAPNVTGENFTVGSLLAPPEADPEAFAKQQLVLLGAMFAKNYPAYQKVAEETTTVDGRPAWGLRFSSHLTAEETGDTEGDAWGLVLAVPNVVENRGLVLVLQGTSRLPELTSAADIGVRGQLPALLASFRFSK